MSFGIRSEVDLVLREFEFFYGYGRCFHSKLSGKKLGILLYEMFESLAPIRMGNVTLPIERQKLVSVLLCYALFERVTFHRDTLYFRNSTVKG